MTTPRILIVLLLLGVGVAVAALDRHRDAATLSAAPDALQVTEIASGLDHPWSLAFLPDGRMLVTEKSGQLRIVSASGRLGAPLAGVPKVYARGQGGLLDVVLAPDFATSQKIYFSYSEPRGGANGTAVARARLGDDALSDVTVIFRQRPDQDSKHHFGSRLVFDRDGLLYVTLGERGDSKALAQDLGGTLGKVVRLTAGGAPAPGNPFVGRADVAPEIWSYGHRNPQGAALHPQTGRLWIHEHGPKGGDEINVPQAGRNYGWPVITYGMGYDGAPIGVGTHKDGMEQPIHYWVPSIAPSGMAFYTADRFPQWRGNLFVGSLKFGQLVRLQLDGEKIVHEQRLLQTLNRRIRDVRQGPDGYLYLLTDDDNGSILRVGPGAH